MRVKANRTLVGIFVVSALVILIAGTAIYGSGTLFKKTNRFVLYFDGSVKGLSIGAPVMFRGVSIGIVQDISLIYDKTAGTIMLPVIVEIEEGRIKGAPSFGEEGGDKKMIALGLRAKLEVQSFLTGQLMILFDFYPDRPAVLRGILKGYPELPTLPISKDIFELMDEMPIKEMARDLASSAKGISKLVNSSDLERSFYEFPDAIRETKEAMRSFRLLTDYLEMHPEAILKGKSVKKGE
ncbi:MAG: MCE family protein [Candidatus Omnitrophica bacterium]|nr:MCE family protein [Candidatus Omnitrophota bacterium]